MRNLDEKCRLPKGVRTALTTQAANGAFGGFKLGMDPSHQVR